MFKNSFEIMYNHWKNLELVSSVLLSYTPEDDIINVEKCRDIDEFKLISRT
jgi:hypothetical protein